MGNWRYTSDFEDCQFGQIYTDLEKQLGNDPSYYLRIGSVDGKKCVTGIGFTGINGGNQDMAPFGKSFHMTTGYMILRYKMRSFQPNQFLVLTLYSSKSLPYYIKLNYHAERSNKYWVGIYYHTTLLRSLTFTEYASNTMDDIEIRISREAVTVIINSSSQTYSFPLIDQPGYLKWVFAQYAKNVQIVFMDHLFSTATDLLDDELLQRVHMDGQGIEGMTCDLYADGTNDPDYELATGDGGLVDFNSIPVPDGVYRISVLDQHGYSLSIEVSIVEGVIQ